MELTKSDILLEVQKHREEFDPQRYTKKDILSVLDKERLNIDDLGALLSPAAEPLIEMIASRAKEETRRFFGNSVNIFTPIYTSNYCENKCVYCGFNKDNDIRRAKLTLEQVEKEMRSISESGLTEVLILTGESNKFSNVEYIGECVKTASKYFRSVGIEVYPLNSDDYAHIRECGADYVTVFQETYDPSLYAELHQAGPKRIFSYRFNAQERAVKGGMRGVSFGALLGLGDFRTDAFSCGVHGYLVQRKYPHAEISFSLPRLRSFKNNSRDFVPVTEKQLLQVALAYRIFMPFAGETISSRESPLFRDNIVGLCATRISGGVDVGIGGHTEKKGDNQFDISDNRSVKEIRNALVKKGLQPIFNDYVRV